MPAEEQSLEPCECRYCLQRLSGVLIAASRIPDRSRQIQFPQAGQAAQLSQFDRLHHRTGQVDPRDVEFALRQLGKIGHGLTAAIERHASFPPPPPLRRFALAGGIGQTRSQTKGNDRSKHAGSSAPQTASISSLNSRSLLPYNQQHRRGLHLIKRSALLLIVMSPLWAQETPFGSGLYTVLEKAACRSCHNPDGVASATRLHFPEPDASPDRIEAFGRSLVTLIDREHPEASLLLNKPTNRIPHAGGERIKPGEQEETILKAWIQRLTRLSGVELAKALKYREEEMAAAGQTRPKNDVRRLTHSQFNNTVRDLLGDQTTPANHFPPDDFVKGFRNQTQAQRIST